MVTGDEVFADAPVDVVQPTDAVGPGGMIFWCPGCECAHFFTTDRWTWNGSTTKPTVNPSILVQYDGSDAGVGGAPPKRCHFFLRDGRLEYCGDSTHALAGQIVPMEVGP